MTGAYLNALGILLGGLLGMILRRPLPVRTQVLFRTILGLGTVVCGVRLVWLSVSGTFLSELKQLLLALLAVCLGFWLGKLLRLQKGANRLGRRASNAIAAAQSIPPRRTDDGFIACTILFCAAPLGWLGAVADGLSGYFWLLAIKAVMDALAMTSFVKMFRWPAALSALPVCALLGGITFICQTNAAPWLAAHHLVDSVNAVAGLVACTVTLVIFETRKVELTNFLPSLVVAPLLAWWLN